MLTGGHHFEIAKLFGQFVLVVVSFFRGDILLQVHEILILKINTNTTLESSKEVVQHAVNSCLITPRLFMIRLGFLYSAISSLLYSVCVCACMLTYFFLLQGKKEKRQP